MQSFHHLRHEIAAYLADRRNAAHRPEFWWPSRLIGLTSMVFLLAPTWPLFLLFPPTLLLALRYYELATFAPVHRSAWLWGIVLLCSLGATLWSCEHHAGQIEHPLQLALAATVVGIGWHLRSHQRELLHLQQRLPTLWHKQLDRLDPLWACGGPLAVLPVLFLWGLQSGLAGYHEPLTLLWGLLAGALLMLQLRQHPLFAHACVLWLALFLAIEARSALNGSDSDDWFLATMVLMLVLATGIYLEFHPRPRRTFAEATAPARGTATPTPAVPRRG